MRKTLIAVVLLAACAKNDAAKTDTTAATQAGGATTPAAPAAPAKLTPADLAGTYKGESKPEGKDSVVGKWTSIMVNDSTSKIAFEGTKDTVTYSVRFDADSFIGTSKPYIDPSLPKGAPKVTFYTVGRKTATGVAGWAALHLASKPDSVIGKIVWTGAKAP